MTAPTHQLLLVFPPASPVLPNRYSSWFETLSIGNRTSLITLSTTATIAGSLSALINGSHAGEMFWSGGQTLRELKFDFQFGNAVLWDAFGWTQDAGSAQGTWVFEWSDDDSNWTTIGSAFSLVQTTTTQVFHSFDLQTFHRYYRLRQTGGVTSGAPYLIEMQCRIASSVTLRDPYESGDRTSLITVTTNATLLSGTSINNLIDGGYDTASTSERVDWISQSSVEIKFDLLGVQKKITDFVWIQTGSASHGTWVFEGSNDNSSWTGLGSSFTLGSASAGIDKHNVSNSTAYSYYRLRQTAGLTSNIPLLMEVEFVIIP